MIRAVLTDWGLTLFDTAGSVDFLERWAAERCISVSSERLAEVYREAFARSRRPEELAKGRDLSPATHRLCWLDIFSVIEEVLPGVAEDLYAFETSAAGWRPFPDTPGFLRELQRRRLPLVIVSDVPFDLRPILAHYGLGELVHDYVLSGEHGSVKADGHLFRIALESAGVRPDEALMVGDNPANDGHAVYLGIRTLLLPLPEPGAERGLRHVLGQLD